MATYEKVASGINHHFQLSFPGANSTTEVLNNYIQAWMRLRCIGIGCRIELDGTVCGSKNPQYEADLSPEDFRRRLEDLANFVASEIKSPNLPEVLLGKITSGGPVVCLGLSEGYGPTVKTHVSDEVNAWFFRREQAGTPSGNQSIEPCRLVYGGWPDGATVGTGSEQAALVHLSGLEHDQVKPLIDELASFFNQSRYYVERDDQIEIYERKGDQIPGA